MEAIILLLMLAITLFMIKVNSKKVSIRCTNCGDAQHRHKSDTFNYFCNNCKTIFRKR